MQPYKLIQDIEMTLDRFNQGLHTDKATVDYIIQYVISYLNTALQASKRAEENALNTNTDGHDI